MINVDKGDLLLEGKPGSGQHFDVKLKRIDFCGTRCYERSEGVYYPSVTSILNAAPMDPFMVSWLQDMGKNAEIVRDRAAREGTAVHEAMEDLVSGKTIKWQDEYGNAKYNLQVWQMILRGFDFHQTYKPEIISAEQFLYSDKYHYAGTTDLLCKLGGYVWLLDYKTSNHISLTYRMQLAAYAKALEELRGIHVDKCGIVWLKAATRTHSKKEGVYQGEGWQVIESENIDKDFEAFLKIYDVFKIFNPKVEPYIKSYPVEVKL